MNVYLYKFIDNVLDDFELEDVLVDYKPVPKWKYEWKSAYDNKTYRKEPYNEDTITVTVVFNSAQYFNLINFLRYEKEILMVFNSDNTTTKQLPVTIDKLPELSDDNRYGLDTCKFVFKSVYKDYNNIDLDGLYGYGENYGAIYGF